MGSTATVTAMFCDCVGSTARQTRIGDTAADEFWQRLFAFMRTNVEESGGYVVKYLGDGIMAVFERSTIGAIECAMRLHQGAADLDPDDPVHLRIGISSGEAANLDGDWYGTPIVEAARLCDAAASDQTLASSVVVSLVGSRAEAHWFRPMGVFTLKGLPGRVDVVEVDGPDLPPVVTGRSEDGDPGPFRRTAAQPRRWLEQGVAGLRRRKPAHPTRWLVGGVAVLAVAMLVSFLAIPGDDGGDTVNSDNGSSSAQGVEKPEGYTPELRTTSCASLVSENLPGAECSNLVVPESRDDPDNGREVELPVVFVPNPASTADPVVVVDVNEPVERSSMRSAADVYSLGIRGFAGTTTPMRCEDVARVWTESLTARPDDDAAVARKATTAGDCAGALTAGELDLASYSMRDVALDIRDLLVAAELDRVSVAAGGPTSPAAVAFTRAHPGAVGALVLTNPTPPGESTQAEPARSVSKQFGRLVELCNADAGCATSFPDLDTQYRQRFEQLDAAPLSVVTNTLGGQGPFTVLLDGRRLAAALEAGLQASSQVGLLPASLLGASPELVAAAALNEDVNAYIAPTAMNGAYLAATCSYDAQPNQTAEIADATLKQFAGANDPSFSPTCDAFDVPSVFDELAHPLDVDLPVLLVVGGLSISGVNGWADQMAASLPDVTVATFATMSEDLSYAPPACLRGLRASFVVDPHASRDVAGCEAQSPPIDFVEPG